MVLPIPITTGSSANVPTSDAKSSNFPPYSACINGRANTFMNPAKPPVTASHPNQHPSPNRTTPPRRPLSTRQNLSAFRAPMTATTIPRKTRSTPLKIAPPGPVCAAYKTFAVQTKPSAEFRKPAPVPERCAKPTQAQSKTASPTKASAPPPLQAPAEDCCATTARHKPENAGDTAPNHKSYTLREPPHCATRPEM